eukprot:m.91607 g.91607  ORF g.91607 m.91607 type:complete len:203 (-) comp51148_c0_seq18:523-1131(-)
MMLVMWLIVLGVGVVQLPFLADLFGGSRWTDTRTSRALVLLVAALCSAALAIFYFAFFPAAVHSFGSDAQLWWITWIYIVAVIVLWPNTVYNYAAAVMVLPRTISVEVEATEQTDSSGSQQKHQDDDDDDEAEVSASATAGFCQRCQRRKPSGVHHCRVCKRCSYFDHRSYCKLAFDFPLFFLHFDGLLSLSPSLSHSFSRP